MEEGQQLKIGDMVRIMRLSPRISHLPDEQRKIYELCLGGTFKIAALRGDFAIFEVGSGWDHVDDALRHEFVLEIDCLKIVLPIPEDDWASLSHWCDQDKSISGKIIGFSGRDLKVRLSPTIVADLPIQYLNEKESADPLLCVGQPVTVRIVMLNRILHMIRVAPASKTT